MVTRGPERRYVGSATIALKQGMRDRLWKRVQEKEGVPLRGIKEPTVQWTQPGLVGRVRHLKGEEKLRHATLTEIEDD